MKSSTTSLTVVTAALLAWPVLTATPARAEGAKKPKTEEAATKAVDPEKKKKREEERARKKMAANPDKKPGDGKKPAEPEKKPGDDKNPAKKPEEAKKPEPAKQPVEPAKKPEPAKQPVEPAKKPEPAKQPAETAKKPEPAKQPAETAKKPEPAKPAPVSPPAPAPAAANSVVATVIYDKGSGANLKGRDEALEKVRAALKQNPGAKFSITGHADDTPYPVANQEISENRAKFLAAYLRTNGIPKDRVESRGVGNTQAVKGQPNRRAVIEMKK